MAEWAGEKSAFCGQFVTGRGCCFCAHRRPCAGGGMTDQLPVALCLGGRAWKVDGKPAAGRDRMRPRPDFGLVIPPLCLHMPRSADALVRGGRRSQSVLSPPG